MLRTWMPSDAISLSATPRYHSDPPPFVIPRSEATRNLLFFAREKSRFLTAALRRFGMTKSVGVDEPDRPDDNA